MMPLSWPPVFNGYGISLQPIAHEQLELIRQWRNDPCIANFMLNTAYISPEQQQQWFANIQNDRQQAYWMIYFRDEAIGVASLQHIDYQKQVAVPGLYIYPAQYRQNLVPFCAAFALHDIAFDVLGLQRLRSIVLANNVAALRFNLQCGYENSITEQTADGRQWQWQILEQGSFAAAKPAIARFIRYDKKPSGTPNVTACVGPS
jgi:UDP-4-amino-4,6-dideoxy-N-acetyl-beta-L-altrosamine N-acetyltransferase